MKCRDWQESTHQAQSTSTSSRKLSRLRKNKIKMQPPMKQGNSNDFQTPEEALNPLIPHLKKEWMIWECAEGKGKLKEALAKRGFKVYGSDILTGTDFLITGSAMADCIITNPPYSIKQKFLQRCYEFKKPFALLLPLTTFETEKRQNLFKRYGLEVIFLKKRINFETPSGQGSGSWFATAWFTNWLNIGNQLTFVELLHIQQKKLNEVIPD